MSNMIDKIALVLDEAILCGWIRQGVEHELVLIYYTDKVWKCEKVEITHCYYRRQEDSTTFLPDVVEGTASAFENVGRDWL